MLMHLWYRLFLSWSQELVRYAYKMIADDVLQAGMEVSAHELGLREPQGQIKPNWGKIAALFVVASAFCIDCLVQGHADYLA